MSRTLRSLLLGLGALSLLCCSLVLDPATEQCTTDSDCVAKGPDLAGARCVESTCLRAGPVLDAGAEPELDAGDTGPLRCLGQGTYIPPDPSRRLMLTQRFQRQSTSAPIKAGEATIRLCNRSDFACSEPRAVLEPDDDGYVRIEVEYGFSGYFELVSEGLQSSMIVINPLTEDAEGPALQVLSPAIAQYLASTLLGSDYKIDPTLANTILAVEDCDNKRLAGISYSATIVDPQNRTRAFYILNPGSPTPGGTETNELGQGGFLNLPPGVGSISGTYNVQQRKVVRIDIPLRANFFTYALLRPIDYL